MLFIQSKKNLVIFLIVSLLGPISLVEGGVWEMDVFIFNINWSVVFFVDSSSKVFGLTILIISSLIFLYSWSYMEGEKEKSSFFIVLFLFILSMLILIYSFNMSSLLLGWDGLGVTSFLLIMFYHNSKSLNAAMITMMINRGGDSMLLISVVMLSLSLSWNQNIYFNVEHTQTLSLLMMAAMTKSAQFPFSSWLPLAMAAPTPVSSLVHSSTLVTAGIYLVYRFYEVMGGLEMGVIVSYLTALVGGLMAMYSFDLKEIVAYSTLSQVGMIMFFLCLGLKPMSFFHLITHAFFKSTLFMCSGYLIHMFVSQDLRTMNSKKIASEVMFSLTISSFAMSSVPFMAGYYSKDGMLEGIFFSSLSVSGVIMSIFLVLLTPMYVFRMLWSLHQNNYSPLSLFNYNLNLMTYSIYLAVWPSMILGSAYHWVYITGCFMWTPLVVKFYVLTISMMGIMISGMGKIFPLIVFQELKTLMKGAGSLMKMSGSLFLNLESGMVYFISVFTNQTYLMNSRLFIKTSLIGLLLWIITLVF